MGMLNPIFQLGEASGGGASTDWSVFQTMDLLTITFPDGASSNLSGTEVEVYPGEYVRVTVPDAVQAALTEVYAKVRRGVDEPDANDFFYLLLKPATGATDFSAWGSAANSRYVDDAKLVDTAGVPATTPSNPTSSYWVATSTDTTGTWVQMARIEPASANFKYSGLATNSDAVNDIERTSGNDATFTGFRSSSAAPTVGEVLLWFDDTATPATDSYFVVEEILFRTNPQMFSG